MRSSLSGWTGKVLHLDLNTRQSVIQYPAQTLYERCLGGRGLAGYFMRSACTCEPDHPDLPILIFTGPLSGTMTPTSGRGTIMSRSPLTGGVFDCSVGGNLATRLKQAGWDGLVITGKSDIPCGIEIRDDAVLIRDTEFWGESCDHVCSHLQHDTSTSVAVIGPAAENGARIASVLVDRFHSAGRGGLGAIWAAKNLKYLSVTGAGTVSVHDTQALQTACDNIIRLTAASPFLLGKHGIANHGTAALYDLIDARCMMPTDNFRATRFPHAQDLNAAAYHRLYAPQAHGCAGCHIRCKRVAKDGRAIPDFEAMSHFTALLGNEDIETCMQANELCRTLGLDPLSAGSTLACFREISQENFTPRTLLTALHDMAHGGPLGLGSLDFAESCGKATTSMTVKGLELPAYDPRGAYGIALAYAINTRGGCHQRAYPVSHEILRKPVATDRFSFSGKARMIKIAEDQNAVIDSLGVCRFTFVAAGLEEYAAAYTAVTGVPMTGSGFGEIGERVLYNERIMHTLNGFDVCDDDLPPRFFTTPGASGSGIPLPPLDRQDFLEARRKYYFIRGLDDHGKPTQMKARTLGLELKQ